MMKPEAESGITLHGFDLLVDCTTYATMIEWSVQSFKIENYPGRSNAL